MGNIYLGEKELTQVQNINVLSGDVETLSGDVGTVSGNVMNHVGNETIHVTSDEKLNWNNKVDENDITNFFDGAKYEDSGTTKVINFYHGDTIKATINATDFIKDGMVSNVEVKEVAGSGTCLVITFNEDSGTGSTKHEDINIPLTDIFDPSNYYTTGQTSGATALTTAFAAKANTATTLSGYGITNAYTKSELTGSSTTVVVAKASSASTAASADSVALSNVSGADDIKAIEALTGNSGLLKKTAANTWSLDTTTYVPTGRTITTASGLTGGGNLSANRTIGLATTGTAGTYYRVVTDAYGRVISGNTADANTNYYTSGLTVATATTTTTITVKGNNAAVKGTAVISAATSGIAGVMTSTDKAKLDSIESGATKVVESTVTGWGFTKNTGTVTKAMISLPTGLSASTTAITSSGTFDVKLASGYTIPTQATLNGKASTAVVSSSANGLAPKTVTAASSTIATQASEFVLTTTSGGTPTWRKLPANAFNNTNYYTSGLTVATATTTTTITVKGNNAAVKGTAVIPSATTSAAGVMTSTDRSKLDGIAEGANNYVHPTTSGNKHIPSGGSSGKFLGWSSDGTAAWVNNPNTNYYTSGLTVTTATSSTTITVKGNNAAVKGTAVIPSATTSAAGVMASDHVNKLNDAYQLNGSFGINLNPSSGSPVNIDTLVDSGNYYCSMNANVKYVSTLPSGITKAFRLTVGNYFGGTRYVYQTIQEYGTVKKYIRYSSAATTSWSSWILMEDDLSDYLTGITKSQVTTALGYTPPTSNTWRSIKVNGTNFLTDASTALNLSAGTNVTLTTGSTGLITIKATDTDTKVTAVGNHYTPASSTTKSASASGGGTLAFGGSVISGVTLNVDAAGHVTNVSVSSAKLPSNPNTNYYTSGLTVTTATTSTTITVHGNNAAVKGTAVISAGTAAQLSAGTNTYNGLWSAKNLKDGVAALGYTKNAGTVTKAMISLPTGLSASTTAITSSGTFDIKLASGYTIPTQATLNGKASTAVVSSSANGLAPKTVSAASSTIATQASEFVLTTTSGGTPTWRKLPANAFNNTNYYPSGVTITTAATTYKVALKGNYNAATGATFTIPSATSSEAGLMASFDKSKFDMEHKTLNNGTPTISGSGYIVVDVRDGMFQQFKISNHLNINSAYIKNMTAGERLLLMLQSGSNTEDYTITIKHDTYTLTKTGGNKTVTAPHVGFSMLEITCLMPPPASGVPPVLCFVEL